jgi:hypothetical protein
VIHGHNSTQFHSGHSHDAPTRSYEPTPATPHNGIPQEIAPIDGSPIEAIPAPSTGDPAAPSTLDEPAAPNPDDAEDKSANRYRTFKTARSW